ncbi:copper ion binding [Ascochyta rabiei]|uniref:Copper ion binding n=1 Tax=Didymella rabiei TaxID=5454 RepID=A0A162ZWD5_DIDRA|nr:copper ion binding [Ascochyta rabiei]
MWADINGERKKVACGPCIRGHRSSKCDHRDRVLVEVRKPGRPLSSCPHPTGSCSCERIVINYTIPKTSECACPSERAQSVAVAGNSRISKHKRKSTAVHPTSLEKAIKASQDVETDTSSYSTPTERSASNEASPPSSASSTPRMLPTQKAEVSSCCKPKPAPPPVAQAGGCCSNKAKQQQQPTPITAVAPAPIKSCCAGKPQPNNVPNAQNGAHNIGQHFQFQIHPQFRAPQYQSFPAQAPTAPPPFGFGAPIYNHAAAAYQQSMAMPMNGAMHGSLPHHAIGHRIPQHNPEHNCHCGEGCSCFGCAAHPNNATMMEYVRLMAEFQYTGAFGGQQAPLYDMPTYPHHPGFGAETSSAVSFTSLPQSYALPNPTHMPFQASLDATVMADSPLSLSDPWRQRSVSSPSISEPQYLDSATPTPTESQLKLEMAPPTAVPAASTPVADSPSVSNGEETPTLSPSSFFWNEMVLPGCNDATGTCQCGDGCECVGCLTHGGHNGIAFGGPSISEHEAFSTFHADVELNSDMNDPTAFLNFNAAS